MSRIDVLECQYTDLEWYGVDRKGNIAVFLSAGCANVPEFVCGNKERTEALIDYFENVNHAGGCVLCGEFAEGTASMAQGMAGRGVYCYDAVEGQRNYQKLARPEQALSLRELPQNIRDMLEHNRMDIEDYAHADIVQVSHAYD